MCRVQLSQEQTTSVQSYVRSSIENLNTVSLPTTGFTFQLNALLRANVALGNELNQYLNTLDSSFSNTTISEGITVYRACNYLEMLRYIQGNRFIDFGYMSTSKDIIATQKFYQQAAFGYFPAFLTINIPENSHVLDLENIEGFDNNTYEGEILIKRKSLFEISVNNVIPTTTLIDEIGIQTQQDFQEIRVLEMNFLNYI